MYCVTLDSFQVFQLIFHSKQTFINLNEFDQKRRNNPTATFYCKLDGLQIKKIISFALAIVARVEQHQLRPQ